MSAKSLSLRKKFLFSFALPLIIFGLTEASLRFAKFEYRPDREISKQRSELWATKAVHQDPTLLWSWIPTPGASCHIPGGLPGFQYNSLGFRGHLFLREKPDDTLRIICMGDSCTLGYGVRDEETFCSALPSLLRPHFHRRIETINAGVIGYDSEQGLHQLRTRLLALKPDMIICSYNWNDHAPAISMESMAYDDETSHPDKELSKGITSYRIRKVFSDLRIFQLEHLLIERSGLKTPANSSKPVRKKKLTLPSILRVSEEDYLANFLAIAKLSRENQVIPIFMTQPCREPVKTDPLHEFLVQKQEEYNRALLTLESKPGNGFYRVDMTIPFQTAAIPRRLFTSTVHPTPLGHQVIAKQLAETIEHLDEWRQYRH